MLNKSPHSQNDIYWSPVNRHELVECKKAHGENAMAWVGIIDGGCLLVVWFDGSVNGEVYLDKAAWSDSVASDGSKSTLVFIEEGVKVNTQDYIKMLTEKVLLWNTESIVNRYIFTQNGPPSYISKLTQQWCKDHFSWLYRANN